MSSSRPDRPNIILFSSDSMDGRVMGRAGHPAANTPNFDRLASRGVLFQNAYCNSPQCVPSRASMWSGRFTHAIEGWNNYKGLEPDDPTFMTELARAGYRTQIIGRDDHLSGKHSIRARVNAWTRGADLGLSQRARMSFLVEETDARRYHEGDWARVDECVKWLRDEGARDADPFLLSFGVGIPHPPFHTSRYWYDRIAPERVSLPPEDESPHPAHESMMTAKNSRGHTPEEILIIRRAYYAMVAETDAMLGEVMAALDEVGLSDTTCVMYISDHGEMNMEHGQHLKNALYEGSARVPLIVAGPGTRQGAVVEELVSLVDVFPTLMDIAAVERPEDLDGYSLAPFLKGLSADRPDWVLSEYHSNFQNTSSFMLRRGEWKYLAYPGFEPQLFNLAEDPEEVRDLVEPRRDVAREMDDRLRRIVDYEAVSAAVDAYGRRSFMEWRESLTQAEYHETMSGLYADWGQGPARKLEAWLASA